MTFLIHYMLFFLLFRLNVAILPMLLHLHQSQLDFLVNFFGRKNTLKDQFPNSCQDLQVLHTFHDLMLLDLHDWDCNPPEH